MRALFHSEAMTVGHSIVATLGKKFAFRRTRRWRSDGMEVGHLLAKQSGLRHALWKLKVGEVLDNMRSIMQLGSDLMVKHSEIQCVVKHLSYQLNSLEASRLSSLLNILGLVGEEVGDVVRESVTKMFGEDVGLVGSSVGPSVGPSVGDSS